MKKQVADEQSESFYLGNCYDQSSVTQFPFSVFLLHVTKILGSENGY